MSHFTRRQTKYVKNACRVRKVMIGPELRSTAEVPSGLVAGRARSVGQGDKDRDPTAAPIQLLAPALFSVRAPTVAASTLGRVNASARAYNGHSVDQTSSRVVSKGNLASHQKHLPPPSRQLTLFREPEC